MPWAKEKQREWFKRRRAAIRELVEQGKDKPCADCGVKYPSYVMQYDHVRGEKLLTLGCATKQARTLQAVTDEIEKCDVICANCHHIRSFNRREDWKSMEVTRLDEGAVLKTVAV